MQLDQERIIREVWTDLEIPEEHYESRLWEYPQDVLDEIRKRTQKAIKDQMLEYFNQ